MSYKSFKILVDKFVQMRQQKEELVATSTLRQDDEYTTKAVDISVSLNNLYKQIEYEIKSTNDQRFANYFYKKTKLDTQQIDRQA